MNKIQLNALRYTAYNAMICELDEILKKLIGETIKEKDIIKIFPNLKNAKTSEINKKRNEMSDGEGLTTERIRKKHAELSVVRHKFAHETRKTIWSQEDSIMGNELTDVINFYFEVCFYQLCIPAVREMFIENKISASNWIDERVSSTKLLMEKLLDKDTYLEIMPAFENDKITKSFLNAMINEQGNFLSININDK